MSKTLVAYFSASGVTAAVAKKLAAAIGADLFEIEPEVFYTEEDLDWRDSNSRSSVEMNDRSCRPAMEAKVENMAQYDVVFVGFPIWWYREPSIIDTFMEAHDFNGKKVVPFCTSGGNTMGAAAKNMQALASGATVIDGKRFTSSVLESELKAWAESVVN